MNIIAWLIFGAIAGYLAGFLVKGDEGYGVIGHVVLGIVGALVGGFLASLLFNVDDPIQGALDISTIVVRSSARSSRSSCSTWSLVEPGPAAAQSRQPPHRRPGSFHEEPGRLLVAGAFARDLDGRETPRRATVVAMIDQLSDEALALIGSAAVATVVTLNADGSPHISAAWIGLEDGELVFGTLPDQRKLRNLRRDPRIAVTLQGERINQWGLREYLVIDGTARVTDGGAPNSSSAWRGPTWAPTWSSRRCRTRPPGFVTRVTIERVSGIGPWRRDAEP